VPKDDPRVEAYGTLDEANSALGFLATALDPDLRELVRGVQRVLFDIGAELASPQPGRVAAVPAEAVAALEAGIDAWEETLEPLRQFILPGGTAAASICHLARTLVRRAERRAVTLARSAAVNPEILRYLNRLSDWLFVLARVLNQRGGVADVPWEGQRRG
jgi:cob(I)alamin adenosyltransferase